MNDDKDLSLQELSRKHGAPIISQLVNIGVKGNVQNHVKFLPFIRELKCLRLMGSYLSRCSINAEKEPEYVALSYTWTPSDDEIQEEENDEDEGYLVESWNGRGLELSSVRNCILRRVIGYMEHTGVELLWIDAHCIRQETCGDDDDCGHSQCIEKRLAIQAMDLVYQLSEHPLALLGRRLKTEAELTLLSEILSGHLVVGRREFQLSTGTTLHVARDALALLSRITQDNWWRRAWTFQENYRAGPWMTLMIPYDPSDPSLEQQKLRCKIFGEIRGELCIESVVFSREATRLCLALRNLGVDAELIEGVLRAAGRYGLILENSRSMTPGVVSDIEARGLLKPWDRLEIVANCCQYSTMLDIEALSRKGRSPSLSVLAMCLLNGEILDNGDNEISSVGELTMSELLNKIMFRKFNPPRVCAQKLTHIKGCRFLDVELTASGIATKGHLWKLVRIIHTSTFSPASPPNMPARWINKLGLLDLYDKKSLLQLIDYLRRSHLHFIANRIDGYVADNDWEDWEDRKRLRSFTKKHLLDMATELAEAIQSNQNLALGAIWDNSRSLPPSGALFVWPGQDNGEPDLRETFVFTSMWAGNTSSGTYGANDINRRICLEVDMEPLDTDGVPQLRVRRGLQGMCFFKDCRRREVLFPWPRALEAVIP